MKTKKNLSLNFVLITLSFFSLNIFFTNDLFAQRKTDNYGIFDIPLDQKTWEPLDSLGVGWVREQFRAGEVDINLAIIFYEKIFSEGYGLLLTLHHRDSTNIENIESFRSSTRGSYPPADETKYKALIASIVETLADVLVSQNKNPDEWLMIQFCNEVAPIDIVGDNPIRFWHGTSDEYLETLALTYDAVKLLNQYNIPVVCGGISSGTMESIDEFDRDPSSADTTLTQLYNFNDRLLREGKFDWADVHLRHAKEKLEKKIQWVKERWNGKLAATEFAGPDVRTGIVFTEKLQAQELVERMIIASNEGVDRIFWSHFVENPAVEEVFFQEGLIEYETWRRKPAYYAYRDYLAGLVNTDVEEESVPAEFQLYQNYPNPFNPETNISYRLATSGKVTLEIFDLLGQKIQTLVDEEQAAGVHEISFTANNLSSGIYMYHLRSNGFVQSKKMILLR